MTLAKKIINWTRRWFERNDRKTAVIGISGGKDSAVVAALCREALGCDHVVGIMMPNGHQKDISDSETVVQELGIFAGTANIQPVYNAMLDCVREAIGQDASEGAKINIAPRIRMALLYAVAQTLSETKQAKACVVGTGNRGEAEIGYTTKGGDSLSDVNPIRNLWTDEVVQVGDEMHYFPHIVHKEPADGLCGKSDEARLGFSYADVKAVFTGEEISEDLAEAILMAHKASKHKRDPIPSYPDTIE